MIPLFCFCFCWRGITFRRFTYDDPTSLHWENSVPFVYEKKGVGACYRLGYLSASSLTVTIGSNSCQNFGACQLIGTKSSEINIGTGSCDAENSCAIVGRNNDGGTITIGDNSCAGVDLVCTQFARNLATSDNINIDKCTTDCSCCHYETNSGDVSINAETCDVPRTFSLDGSGNCVSIID